jgi:hypothetical protein
MNKAMEFENGHRVEDFRDCSSFEDFVVGYDFSFLYLHTYFFVGLNFIFVYIYIKQFMLEITFVLI